VRKRPEQRKKRLGQQGKNDRTSTRFEAEPPRSLSRSLALHSQPIFRRLPASSGSNFPFPLAQIHSPPPPRSFRSSLSLSPSLSLPFSTRMIMGRGHSLLLFWYTSSSSLPSLLWSYDRRESSLREGSAGRGRCVTEAPERLTSIATAITFILLISPS